MCPVLLFLFIGSSSARSLGDPVLCMGGGGGKLRFLVLCPWSSWCCSPGAEKRSSLSEKTDFCHPDQSFCDLSPKWFRHLSSLSRPSLQTRHQGLVLLSQTAGHPLPYPPICCSYLLWLLSFFSC